MYFFPSLNDKDDRNDKESEKSPVRVIGRGLRKPFHSCHARWIPDNLLNGTFLSGI